MFFVVVRRSGPDWAPGKPLEQQSGWEAHAAFMDGLVDSGFVVLGGPLAGDRRVLLVVAAEDEGVLRTRFADDPWIRNGMLTISGIESWTVLLDGRAA